MRRAGFLLFVAGMVLACWFAARPIPSAGISAGGEEGAVTAFDRLALWGSAAGLPFGIGVLMMFAGGIVARRAGSQGPPTDDLSLETGRDALAMLREVDRAVGALPTSDPRECADRLHEQLDEILEDLVPAFLEERQHHVAQLGLSAYAEMSSAFASAERALARAWSALTDEAWEEVAPRLAAARESMAQAVRVVEEG